MIKLIKKTTILKTLIYNLLIHDKFSELQYTRE